MEEGSDLRIINRIIDRDSTITIKPEIIGDRWFTMNSSVRRAHFNREVRRMSQAAANTIKNDAKRLAEWRAKHEPGACGS